MIAFRSFCRAKAIDGMQIGEGLADACWCFDKEVVLLRQCLKHRMSHRVLLGAVREPRDPFECSVLTEDRVYCCCGVVHDEQGTENGGRLPPICIFTRFLWYHRDMRIAGMLLVVVMVCHAGGAAQTDSTHDVRPSGMPQSCRMPARSGRHSSSSEVRPPGGMARTSGSPVALL